MDERRKRRFDDSQITMAVILVIFTIVVILVILWGICIVNHFEVDKSIPYIITTAVGGLIGFIGHATLSNAGGNAPQTINAQNVDTVTAQGPQTPLASAQDASTQENGKDTAGVKNDT